MCETAQLSCLKSSYPLDNEVWFPHYKVFLMGTHKNMLLYKTKSPRGNTHHLCLNSW